MGHCKTKNSSWNPTFCERCIVVRKVCNEKLIVKLYYCIKVNTICQLGTKTTNCIYLQMCHRLPRFHLSRREPHRRCHRRSWRVSKVSRRTNKDSASQKVSLKSQVIDCIIVCVYSRKYNACFINCSKVCKIKNNLPVFY